MSIGKMGHTSHPNHDGCRISDHSHNEPLAYLMWLGFWVSNAVVNKRIRVELRNS